MLVAAAPVIWMSLDLAGSGSALKSSQIAQTSPLGSAARAANPGITVVSRAADAVLLPILVLALLSVPLAYRRRSWPVLTMAAGAITWILIVAVMAESGFTGRRRYLILAAALMCVLAGIAAGWLIRELPASRRRFALAALGVVLAAFAFSPARTDYRLLDLARDQKAQLGQLRDAVDAAGGAGVARRARTACRQPVRPHRAGVGARPAAPPREGDLVLDARGSPGWSPPAVLFRGPARLAGPRPALHPGQGRTIARVARWRVVSVPR